MRALSPCCVVFCVVVDSVEALWCNRTLEMVKNINRSSAGPAGDRGAAGSMRAIPLVNNGSMKAMACAGSMRALTGMGNPSAGAGVSASVDAKAVEVWAPAGFCGRHVSTGQRSGVRGQ